MDPNTPAPMAQEPFTAQSLAAPAPAAPASPAPAAAPEPPAAPAPVPKSEGLFSNKLEIAQCVVLGIMAASFLYSIYYYRQQLKNPSLMEMKREIAELRERVNKTAKA